MTITLSPGVISREHPSGQAVARGAIAARLLAIGMARKGPINTPVAVRSYEQFVDRFGDDLSFGELALQMRQAFTAGLGDAVVVRTANGSRPARHTLKTEFGDNTTLKIEAVDAGVLGNTIRVSVDYDTPDPEMTFNLTLWRETIDEQGRFGREELESFPALSMDPEAPNFAKRVVNGVSRLVTVEPLHDAPDLAANNEGKVFSQSGLYHADAAALDASLAAITGEQRIAVEIDGRDVVPVILSGPLTRNKIRQRINAALGARSLSATVKVTAHNSGNGFALRIAVNSTDGTRSIRILPGTENDGTGALALGTLRGGIEVGLYSAHRPAMTGITTRPFTAAGNIAPLEALLGVGGALWSILFNDGTPSGTITTALNWGVAGATSPMDDGDATTPLSLASLAANLDSLVATLSAADPLGEIWTFERIGLRVRATRNDGLVTPSEAAGFDTGADAIAYLDDAVAVRPAYGLGQDGGDTTGLDGTAPVLADYQTVYGRVSRMVDIFNMLIQPRGHEQTDAMRGGIWGAASAFCRAQNALLIMDPRSDDNAWSTVDEVVEQPRLTEFKSGVVPEVSCTFWPRVRVPVGTGQVHIDPCGTMAGVIASTVARLGVWNAAAGLSAPLVGVTGLEYPMSDADNGVINPRGINALRAKSTGNVSWGVRTLAGDDAFSNRDFAYIQVRMTTDFIKNSLDAALQDFVFKSNNPTTWAIIELMCKSFLQGLLKRGAFASMDATEAYHVRIDETTTSPADIALGIMNIWVFFAPLKPAEFIRLNVKHMFKTTAV